MPGKRTVLFVSHKATLAGAERSLLELLKGLKGTDINPLVLVPGRGPLTDELAREGIAYRVCFFAGWIVRKQRLLKGTARTLVNLIALIRLWLGLRKRPIDLIYTNTVYSPVGGLLSLALGVPHIWHIREFVHEDMQADYDFGTTLSMRFIDRSSTRIICNSRKVYEKVARYIDQEKMTVIYNGPIDTDDRPPAQARGGLNPNKKLRLCLVGTLSPAKGHSDAIRALAVLIEQGIDAELRLVGRGNEEHKTALESLVAQQGVSEQVIWEGYASNVLDIFADADIALVCSRSEAFGRVAVEAMSVGCPVIGTSSGGLVEIIEDGVNGLLYPPGDSAMLGKQIVALASQPDLYRTISGNAITSVYQRFTRARYVAEVEAVILDCAR